jgi:hypothetical protein
MSNLSNCLARVLEYAPPSRINFHLGGLLVTPQGFRDIGTELRNENIHVHPSSALPQDAVAAYDWHTDTLTVYENVRDLINTYWGKAVLVHEAVHAMIDRNRAVATTLLTAEAAAYIAQVLCRLLDHERDFRQAVESNHTTPDGLIFYEALQLISRFGLESGPGTIPWNDSDALRTAISRHPLYQSVRPTDPHGADGIVHHWF